MNCLAILPLLLFSAAPAAPAPPVRESIEWANIWITGGDRSDLPKVLLIGDSIAVGYYQRVADALKDKADCCRLSTSKSLGDPAYLEEVKLVVSQYPFAVIHFNNGLHGWGYTEEQYQEAFPKLLALLRQAAPQAKLIWATTTPVPSGGNLSPTRPLTWPARAVQDCVCARRVSVPAALML